MLSCVALVVSYSRSLCCAGRAVGEAVGSILLGGGHAPRGAVRGLAAHSRERCHDEGLMQISRLCEQQCVKVELGTRRSL